MSTEPEQSLVRVSSDIEEEKYKLAKAAIKGALDKGCEFSFNYAFVLKAQIEYHWFSRIPNTSK